MIELNYKAVLSTGRYNVNVLDQSLLCEEEKNI